MRRRQSDFVCILVLALGLGPDRLPAEGDRTTLGGVAVATARLSTDGTLVPVPLAGETVQVSEAVLAEGQTVDFLLRSRGIRPDSEALTLVYELNPELTSVAGLGKGSRLILPEVRLGANPPADPGSLVALTVAPELKEEFSRHVEGLKEATMRAWSFDLNSCDAPSSAGAAGRSGRSIRQTVEDITCTLQFVHLGILRRNGPPVPEEVLRHLSADAAQVRLVVQRAAAAGPRWVPRAEDQAAVQTAMVDLEIKKRAIVQIASGVRTKRWNGAWVEIRTLKQGREVSGYRIYYAPDWAKDLLRPSGHVTPCKEWLEEADYIFWAGDERDPKRQLSYELPRKVREGEPIEVTLTIKD
jgi:hypothetical protein